MCHHTDYGCQQHFRHTAPRDCYYHRCCCCSPEYAPQRFPTREEIVEKLEEHLNQLRAETKVVEERITELKKESQE